jgi:hypothetical protein
MSVSISGNVSSDIQVVAGEKLVLRVRAWDPAGIKRIFVQCFQFSIGSSSRTKLASGEMLVAADQSFSVSSFDVAIEIPENAALGKWGIQMVEFTNSRGYKTSFYRGQAKFDDVAFEVVAPPRREDQLLEFEGVEISSRHHCAP